MKVVLPQPDGPISATSDCGGRRPVTCRAHRAHAAQSEDCTHAVERACTVRAKAGDVLEDGRGARWRLVEREPDLSHSHCTRHSEKSAQMARRVRALCEPWEPDFVELDERRLDEVALLVTLPLEAIRKLADHIVRPVQRGELLRALELLFRTIRCDARSGKDAEDDDDDEDDASRAAAGEDRQHGSGTTRQSQAIREPSPSRGIRGIRGIRAPGAWQMCQGADASEQALRA
jgi:hypothetical protein